MTLSGHPASLFETHGSADFKVPRLVVQVAPRIAGTCWPWRWWQGTIHGQATSRRKRLGLVFLCLVLTTSVRGLAAGRAALRLRGGMVIHSLADVKKQDEEQGGLPSGTTAGPVDGEKLSKRFMGMYHEKQIGGLCAVHCMNNLLQGPEFNEIEVCDLLAPAWQIPVVQWRERVCIFSHISDLHCASNSWLRWLGRWIEWREKLCKARAWKPSQEMCVPTASSASRSCPASRPACKR